MGIHELLVATDDVKRLIHSRAPVSEILTVAVDPRNDHSCQDGILKTLQGWTDYKQVQAVAMR
jgi:type II secretory ATPase GspE/PulE/Tfp pilus assembly ATPase PilB-like protein